MPFTQHGGIRIHWDEAGPTQMNGAKPQSTILLVMGHRYSSAMWYPVIPELSKKHRVIWFDNEGTGQSGWRRRTSMAEMAGDAFAVMDAAGADKAHIFGVSMGGVIVHEMYRQHPERVLGLIVGCSGILSPDKPRAPWAARLIYYIPKWVLRSMITPEKLAAGYGSAAEPGPIQRDIEQLLKDPYVTAGVRAQHPAIRDYSIPKEEVATWKVPCLVLHGDEDKAVPFAYGEELAATLPGAKFVHLKGAAHNFFVASLPESLEALNSFMDEVDAKH